MDFAFWRRSQRWRRAPETAPAAGGEPGRISRTSQAVALTRAQLDRPHSPEGDPLAQARLCEGMRPTPIERLRPVLTARARVFGEGGDAGGALGSRRAGFRFFERAQGPTQADTARRRRELSEAHGGSGARERSG